MTKKQETASTDDQNKSGQQAGAGDTENQPNAGTAGGKPEAKTGSKKAEAVRALRVSSRPERFRRAGLEFSRQAREIPLEALTEQQVRQLRAEPLLVVQDVEIEAE